MSDRWIEKLECSGCKATGTASLAQDEYQDTPTVVAIDGFRATTTKDVITFFCAKCDAPARP
jgi:hypothetical protein